MKKLIAIIAVVVLGLSGIITAQTLPTREVVLLDELSNYLKPEVRVALSKNGEISISEMAHYFRQKFSERYFYDWRSFDSRFESYKEIYPDMEKGHSERALDHMSKYNGDTQWVLPFNYLNGEPVDAYALRHLARQHKMIDIAFYYNYQDEDKQYLDYFKNQMQSLNAALKASKYEKIKDGNGVYEAFRSGYRILNWLQIHNMFLGQEGYSDNDQLTTIATMLQHAAHLYETNQTFNSGNHQTRGMSALAMVSILLRDFEGADKWYNHSMKLLEEHLTKEINDDGFQFERTVHYHISDIGNYYYVYQLAKTSKLDVNEFWESKLKSLFTTLVKIAYPNKSAPVLSDDTDAPWAESNDISGALTLGYLLFNNPEMGYFANDYVDAKMFWYLSDSQLDMLERIETKKPEYASLHFPTTGYYIMREGWNEDDNMMIISAGLDALKPDHQHGDVLGIQAMANGRVVLPNYQVRYYLKDLELFKNSMTKNVALVDNELQGKQYTSNQGGSGFGKFRELPNPTVISWSSNNNIDVFVGSHDGFKNIGVDYTRQIINLENDFWIVKDNFASNTPHTYKQVWQGHYSYELAPNLLRASFENGTGLDIFQLKDVDAVITDGKRGKEWSVVEKKGLSNFSFITVVYPFKTFERRIDENVDNPDLRGWMINNTKWLTENKDVVSLNKGNTTILFSIKDLSFEGVGITLSDFHDIKIVQENKLIVIQSLGDAEVKLSVTNDGKCVEYKLSPGEECELQL